ADVGQDISEADTLASGTVSISVSVTDGDGDMATKSADVSGQIQFLDDGPTVCADINRCFSVVLDETPGVQSADDDTTSSTVRHLFDSVVNTGSDPDLTSAEKDHGAIGFAIGGSPALDVNVFFGADGPKDSNHNGHADADAIVYSLQLGGVSGDVYS